MAKHFGHNWVLGRIDKWYNHRKPFNRLGWKVIWVCPCGAMKETRRSSNLRSK